MGIVEVQHVKFMSELELMGHVIDMSAGIEQLRVEQRYPPQVQASAESDQVIRIRMSRVES
ncbi:hypothetical protein DEO72_LG5g741 [Vigna unguiculata]|uniref:Uncharacterized protein n=1 Tax=Vigna unguiculata TaxID=3917 RepID=A0A4D6LW40_VIGUN|nr:hypothetical protein DEO72_LG5g741 [Vigna unguiculata]